MSCDKNFDLTVVTDATFSENTKACGISAVLLDECGQPRLALGRRVVNASSNEEGELRAILFALEEIPNDNMSVLIQSDNQNAVLYLNDESHTSENGMRYVRKIRNRIQQKNLNVTFVWQSRIHNDIADAVAAFSTKSDVWARLK